MRQQEQGELDHQEQRHTTTTTHDQAAAMVVGDQGGTAAAAPEGEQDAGEMELHQYHHQNQRQQLSQEGADGQQGPTDRQPSQNASIFVTLEAC